MLAAAWKRSTLCLALVIACSGAASAAELSLELGVEGFYWREYDAGARLLEERGPRFRLGGNWRQPLGMDGRDNLLLRGALYFGEVNYDGRSMDLLTLETAPLETDGDYTGAALEATVARRLDPSSRGEVFLGGGIDTWRRDIKAARDANGTDVAGAIEDWTVFYLLVGGGSQWRHSAVRYHLQGGIKHPFYTYEAADFDLELEPKGRPSFFARFTADFIRAGHPRGGFGIYYDSYRFDQSDPEPVFIPGIGLRAFIQPESHQDTIGLYAALYF